MASFASLMMPGVLSIILIAMVVLPVPAIKSAISKKIGTGRRNTGLRDKADVAARTRKGSTAHAERQADVASRSDLENLKKGVELWHGQGSKSKSMRDACAEAGINRRTLSNSINRTLIHFNEEESAKRNPELIRSDDIYALRKIPISRVLRLTELSKMGRGDALTAQEISRIKDLYDAKCRNFKDAPKANGSTDADVDDFAATVNEVFAETRSHPGHKSLSSQFTPATMLKWAKVCDISFTGLVPAGDYRSSALSNWRNMISNIAVWVGVIHASPERKVRAAFMYNCDDTTLFLDQKRAKHRTLVSNTAKARGRKLHLSFSLSLNRKNHASQRSSKHYAHRQRTVKLNAVTSATGELVCTVIQISDYEITRVQVVKLSTGIYMVLQPAAKKGKKDFDNESAQDRVLLATRVLRDCILESIVEDRKSKIEASKHALVLDSQGSGKFTNSPLKDDDICMEGDRAVLCFDGDYPYIEAILSDTNKTRDGLTLRECFAQQNVELVKFSGGCSMCQQPNDRSRCFFCLKQSAKKFVYKGLAFVHYIS